MTERSWSRRPIDADEVPHLEALGHRLRSLRLAAGLTQEQLAAAAEMTRSGLGKLERGERRTRRSTIDRLAAVLNPEDTASTTTELVELAGHALAPESEYAERVARRRHRRAREREVAELRRQYVRERRARLARYGFTSLTWAGFVRDQEHAR